MSTKIYPQGNVEVTVPASSKITVFSNSKFNVYKQTGYPNLPSTWSLLHAGAAGVSYLSDAFSAATVIRVEAGADEAFYEVGTAPVVAEPMTDQEFADATGVIAGLAAAQGGSSTLKGGTSSTAGNAGGAAALLGGQPGATGVGGAATVTGGAGGATSGTGGAATVTGGAGTNGNAAGGASGVTGGAGQGTGTGGAASVTGGASGAGATGDGGDASITGGAAASTNGNGGSVVLTGGAKAGTGINGAIFQRSDTGYFRKQSAAVAKGDGAQSVTAAQLIGGITVQTITGASTLTTPTGAAILAGCGPDIAAGDSFDYTLITLGAAAGAISTLTAGDANVTFVGDVTVGPAAAGTTSAGTFRFRYAGANAFVGYRIG